MGTFEVTIPQTGEGLQEARLIRFLKQPGDAIVRDEPLLEVETDKAMVQVESPVNGTLLEWFVEPGIVLPVGAVVGRIAVEHAHGAPAEPVPPMPAVSDASRRAVAASAASLRNALLPPRTRAYARECGLSDEDLSALADQLGRKVLPADVDRYVEARVPSAPISAAPEGQEELVALAPAQRTLVYRMQQRAAEVMPATEEILIAWEPIDRLRTALKRLTHDRGGPVPTPFLIFAWCVVRAAAQMPVLRCTYAGDGMLRRHPHLNIGLAVTRNDDELLTAAVERAETLGFADFVADAADAIKRARAGEDQASSAVQISLSNLAGTDVIRAIPIVVAPAVATLFVGAVRAEPVLGTNGDLKLRRVASVTMTFDHRVINGVGAARFLSLIRREVEQLDATALIGSG